MHELHATGIDPEALQRFIGEQIYALPGTSRHREAFSILLTGSRSTGTFVPDSDVDIDVVCQRDIYESVLGASFKVGLVKTDRTFFWTLADADWHRYFGERMGRPHFSLTPLDRVEEHFREYRDVS